MLSLLTQKSVDYNKDFKARTCIWDPKEEVRICCFVACSNIFDNILVLCDRFERHASSRAISNSNLACLHSNAHVISKNYQTCRESSYRMKWYIFVNQADYIQSSIRLNKLKNNFWKMYGMEPSMFFNSHKDYSFSQASF